MGLRDGDCGNYDTNIDLISACYMIPLDGTFYVYTLASCEPSCFYTQNCVSIFPWWNVARHQSLNCVGLNISCQRTSDELWCVQIVNTPQDTVHSTCFVHIQLIMIHMY